jgi:PhnB protein
MAEKTNKIPRNYRSVTPILTITGAAEAIGYYKKVFGAQEINRLDWPDGRVMHAELKIGDSIVMLGDECPAHEGHKEKCPSSPTNVKGSTVSLYVYVDDVDTIVDKAIKANGESIMEVSDTFWGDRVGMIRDPYGHFWMVATHKKDVTPEEMKRGAEEFFTQTAGKR